MWKAGIVKWPMSVIRIRSGADQERLIDLADKILLAWRGYTDEAAFIYAETDGEPHNTITPIARKTRTANIELDLVLRNNITTEEHPLGVYPSACGAASYQKREYRTDRGDGSGCTSGPSEG